MGTFGNISYCSYKGISNEKSGIDQDSILWPLFSISFGSFSLIYGFSGLSSGNLVKKWFSHFLFNHLFFIVKTGKK